MELSSEPPTMAILEGDSEGQYCLFSIIQSLQPLRDTQIHTLLEQLSVLDGHMLA